MSALPQPTGDQFTSEKRPRQYAAEYVKLPTKRERAALLSQVPDNFRPIVESHVRNHFARKRHAITDRAND